MLGRLVACPWCHIFTEMPIRTPGKPSLSLEIYERQTKLSLWIIAGHKTVKMQPQEKAKSKLRSGPILSERQITLLVKVTLKKHATFSSFSLCSRNALRMLNFGFLLGPKRSNATLAKLPKNVSNKNVLLSWIAFH